MKRAFIGLAAAFLLGAGCSRGEGGGREAAVRKAFAEYKAAFNARDVGALKAMVSAEKAAGLDDPNAAQMLEMAASMQPVTPVVSGVKVEGNKAALRLRGGAGGQPVTGAVEMALEGGRWKVVKESWTVKMGPEGGAAPEQTGIGPLSDKVSAQLDEIADPDPKKAGKAWIKLGASCNNARDYLRDVGAALGDARPISFNIHEETFKGGGKSFRYFTTRLEPIDPAKDPMASTVGEALRLYLWQYEDASNSGFQGGFWEWWEGYAARKGLPK